MGASTGKEKQPQRYADRKSERRHRERRHRRGRSASKATPSGAKNLPVVERIFSKKKRRITASQAEIRRQAAFSRLKDERLCRDLAGVFAGKAARRTGRAVGDVRDSYDRIVTEFLARYTRSDGKRYSLVAAMRSDYETDAALKKFLAELARWIEGYVLRSIHDEPQYSWKIQGSNVRAVETVRGHAVSLPMMTALADEYVRDRTELIQFLFACFKRWRKIYADDSLWFVKVSTHQSLRRDPKLIVDYLQGVGALPDDMTGDDMLKAFARIRQYLHRDQKACQTA